MGFYIDTPEPKGKAEYLIKEESAVLLTDLDEILAAFADDKAVICVVDNGTSEDAGFTYDKDELLRFLRPDEYPRKWLSMDMDRACELPGYKPGRQEVQL